MQTPAPPSSPWRRAACATAMFALALTAVVACGSDAVSPGAPDGEGGQAAWQPAWQDEFDQPDGSRPSAARWVFDTGGGGWGNNELQTYTERLDNAVVRGGTLVIRALRETFTGTDGIAREYTSARLKTLGTFSQAYGKFEARIRIPRGQGLWPAFWMLGENLPTAGWPECGEIDIMENVGREPNLVHGTLHGPGHSGAQGLSASFTNPGGRPFADDFHVFGVEWEPDLVRWYVDGAPYATRTSASLPAGARWVYDHRFFVLLNVAVGGAWPGNPDGTTTFPQEMVVDWVRVFRR